MANEIKYDGQLGESGLTLYAVLVNDADGTRWKTDGTPAWETAANNVSNQVNHAIALTESPILFWQGSFPAGIAAGLYVQVGIYERDGAAPVVATDRLLAVRGCLTLGSGAMVWALPGFADALASLGYGISAAVDNCETLVSRLTAARAGYMDNMNVGGLLASQADITGIVQAQRVRVSACSEMGRPDAGSTAWRIWIYAYAPTHVAEDLDSPPTVTAENAQAASRTANLANSGTATKVSGTTGQYYIDYTVAADHAIEGLVFKVTATKGVATVYPAASWVSESPGWHFQPSDRANLNALSALVPTSGTGYFPITSAPDGSGTATSQDLSDLSEQVASLTLPPTWTVEQTDVISL